MSSSSKSEEKKQPSAARERDVDDEESEESETVIVEEKVEQSPLLKIAQWKFIAQLPDPQASLPQKKEARDNIMEQIKKDKMAPYLSYLVSTASWPADAALLSELSAANATELETLSTAITEAEKTAGDIEVRDAMLARAQFYYRIGDKENAIKEFEATLAKTVGSASRIDVVFALIRLGLAFDDIPLVSKQIAVARQFVELGGDWERKNLLGVYEAAYFIRIRHFKEAAQRLISGISTFTCYELMPYTQFIFYAGILSLVSLDRVTLKKKVISSPEILSTIDQIPHLRSFVFSLYECRYDEFFRALSDITPAIQQDRYLSFHLTYYLREIRIVAYNQFLASYRAASLPSMAGAFGVSAGFLDAELYRFIGAGRVNAKIDKVSGVVETNRTDTKNQQYEDLLKQGDLLLNRIQKLTKVITY